MRLLKYCLLLSLVAAASCTSVYHPPPFVVKSFYNPEMKLALIQNKNMVLGAVSEVGGAIVLLRTHEGGNILRSNPVLWDKIKDEIKKPSAENPAQDEGFDGHTILLGPQKDWWTQQDMNVEKKDRRDVWPPDPFLSLGQYEVVEHKMDFIKMTGPKSPISGIQLTKEIKIDKNKVFLKTRAVNVRKSEVSWNMCSDTRLSGHATVYVPVNLQDNARIEFPGVRTGEEKALQCQVKDKFLFFNAPFLSPESDGLHHVSKAFINPSEGLAAIFCDEILLVKKSPLVAPDKLPEKYSFLELSQSSGPSRDESMLEIKMNGEYMTLKPGESMEFSEEWELIVFDRAVPPDEHMTILKEVLSRK